MTVPTWHGSGGVSWQQRNPTTVAAIDELYRRRHGFSRTELTAQYIGARLPRSAQILEVGCAGGVMLKVFERLGYENLTGVDVNADILKTVPGETHVATATDLPFGDRAFELVFTSGTMMHVPFGDQEAATREMARVAGRYIWGYECWQPEPHQIRYADELDLPDSYQNDFGRLITGWLAPTWGYVCGALYEARDGGMVYDCYLLERFT